jgi:hypothetical protein
MYGFSGGITITILRTIIAGFLSGQPFTSLLIGGSGGIAAALSMSLLYHLLGKRNLVSLFGISMVGAAIHSTTQIAVVNLIFVQNNILFWQFPLLGPASIITGAITASIAYKTVSVLRNIELSPSSPLIEFSSTNISILRIIATFFIASVFLLVDRLHIHIYLMLALLVLAFAIRRNKMTLLFWRIFPLVLLTSGINLLTEPGRYIFSFCIITYEGLAKAALLGSRLINIMAISIILIRPDDISMLLRTTGRKLPFLISPCRVGLRTLQNIPTITAIFREEYQKQKGSPLYKKPVTIYRYLSNSMERLLKAF